MTSITGVREAFNERFDALNCCGIVVRASALAESIETYKVYVNRNIHGTGARFKDLAPPNSIYSRVAPGHYKVVLREFDQTAPNRLESNTIEFDLKPGELCTLAALPDNGFVRLQLESIAENEIKVVHEK